MIVCWTHTQEDRGHSYLEFETREFDLLQCRYEVANGTVLVYFVGLPSRMSDSKDLQTLVEKAKLKFEIPDFLKGENGRLKDPESIEFELLLNAYVNLLCRHYDILNRDD